MFPTVFVAADHEPAGALLLEDRIRLDARSTIGFCAEVALSGSSWQPVIAPTSPSPSAAITGVDQVFAGLTPAGGFHLVRREQRQASVIMTGDGINDVPGSPSRTSGSPWAAWFHGILRGR